MLRDGKSKDSHFALTLKVGVNPFFFFQKSNNILKYSQKVKANLIEIRKPKHRENPE